jgi:AbrB family looped-hinge helix DNA binding protein
MKSTISSKGQITVPIDVRRRLGLRTGSTVVFDLRPEGAWLRKGTGAEHPVDKVFGSLRLGTSVDEALDALRGPRPHGPAKPRRSRR